MSDTGAGPTFTSPEPDDVETVAGHIWEGFTSYPPHRILQAVGENVPWDQLGQAIGQLAQDVADAAIEQGRQAGDPRRILEHYEDFPLSNGALAGLWDMAVQSAPEHSRPNMGNPFRGDDDGGGQDGAPVSQPAGGHPSGRSQATRAESIPDEFLDRTPLLDEMVQQKRPWQAPAQQETFTPMEPSREVERVYSMEPAERARVQEMLVRAGALTGDFRYGGMDAVTSDALQRLVEFANVHEIGSVEEAAAEMQEAKSWAERQGVPWPDVAGSTDRGARVGGDPQQSRQRAQQPVYVTPDPAKMRNDVREMFNSNVGRDPTDEELDEWVNRLAAADREEFDASQEAIRQEGQQDVPANMTTAGQILEGSSMGGHPTSPPEFDPDNLAQPQGGSAGQRPTREVQGVNATERFEESLLNTLASEQEGQEEARDEQAGRRMTSRAFRRVGSLMSGGS